jgi:hypothetical protein
LQSDEAKKAGHGMKMRIGGAIFGAALGLIGSVAVAQDSGPVIVELYTSQGCSSCPPADALLAELATHDDVLPLALHVDYWDYIGWADSFAQPQFTQRQHSYAAAAGDRTVYTPQMIIGGLDHVIGTKPMQLMEGIDTHGELETGVSVLLERSGDSLRIEATAGAVETVPLMVQLVRYTPSAQVEVLRGENAGRTLSYTNIVTSWEVVARWDGAAPLSLDLALIGEGPAAVIVQRPGPGLILAAAQVD